MAVSFVTSSEGETANAVTFSIAPVSGVVSGDLMLAFISANHAATTDIRTAAMASEWTLLYVAELSTTWAYIYYKFAGVGESGTYDFINGASSPMQGGIAVYRGVHSVKFLDNFTWKINDIAAVDLPTPASESYHDGAMALHCWIMGGNAGNVIVDGSIIGRINIVSTNGTATNRRRVRVADKAVDSGSVAGAAATMVSQDAITGTLILAPSGSSVSSRTFQPHYQNFQSNNLHMRQFLSLVPSTNDEDYIIPTTGWIVSTVAATKYSRMVAGTEVLAANITDTIAPSPSLDPDMGDAFRTLSPITGQVMDASWAISLVVSAQTAGTTADGQFRVGIFKGRDPFGSDAVQIGTYQDTTPATNIIPAVPQTLNLLYNPPGEVVFNHEYLFIQPIWTITGAGAAATHDVNMRVSTLSHVTLPPMLDNGEWFIPDGIAERTNLNVPSNAATALSYIQDDPNDPDGNWVTAI